jgi:hypothetical protein
MAYVISREEIVEAYRSGMTQREIARKFRLSLRDVSRVLRSEGYVVVSKRHLEELQRRVQSCESRLRSLEDAADGFRVIIMDLWDGLAHPEETFSPCLRCGSAPHTLKFDSEGRLRYICEACGTDELGPV